MPPLAEPALEHPRATKTAPPATEVVIAGAGPTGLALACTLAARGVPFIVVDRLAEGAGTSRAAVVHARTLEVLENLDITRRLLARGHIVPRFTIRDRDRVLVTLRFDALPTPHPYTLMIPQDVTEAILLERLHELGHDVLRRQEVVALKQDDRGVQVTIADGGMTTREIRARFLVGADGMHSTVRQRAGIGFTGGRYEQSFVLADVVMRWPFASDEVMLFFSPEGLVVVAPLPGGPHRIVSTVDDAPEHPSIADVQALLDARGPAAGAAEVQRIVWGSRFRVHHRVADRYRLGSVILAGDAAHVHSPAGGQGMNTGIQDAVALGGALAEALGKKDGAAGRAGSGGRHDEGGPDGGDPLDRYERVRRPVAERVVALTDRMTRVATLRPPWARAARNAVLAAVGRIPAARRWLATELAELRYR